MTTANGQRGGRALVLGGGGLLGVSWETGVLAGLQQGGVDPAAADLIAGTSAGSITGAQLASGKTVEEMLEENLAERPDGIETKMDFDVPNLMAIFQKWAALPEVTQQACAEIGAMAINSRTTSEAEWVSSFQALLPASWPERRLLITTVDAENGEFRVWDRASGLDLHLAVASSCAVPGLFPTVQINGRRYMDGGVRSGTNADLASGYRNVLIIAPIGSRPDGIDPLLARQAKAEAEALRAAGAQVELLFPDAATMQAMGINRMDASRREQTANEGIRQGNLLAKKLRAEWAKAAA